MLHILNRILPAHVTKRFDEWREIWRSEDGNQDNKFELYAKSNPMNARKVHRNLVLMALALFDTRGFEEQFGMKPQRFPERVSPKFADFDSTNCSRNQKTSHVINSKTARIWHSTSKQHFSNVAA